MDFDDKLCADYKVMICKIGWKHTSDPELWKDLVQEGYLGLNKACETFDIKKGSFCTHAYNKIEGQIRQYLNYSVDVMHIPVLCKEKYEVVNIENCQTGSYTKKYPDVYEYLSLIDPFMAKVLKMHYIDGHTKRDLSNLTGVKYITLVKRMNKSLEILRVIMENDK